MKELMEAKRNFRPPLAALRPANAHRKWRPWAKWFTCCFLAFVLIGCMALWLAGKASSVKDELTSAVSLLPELELAIASDDPSRAVEVVERMSEHTSAAREASSDPVWTAARSIPLIGPSFEAISEIATAADDVTRLGASPLAEAFQGLEWQSLVPGSDGVKWDGLNTQLPKITSAAYAVRTSEERLRNMNPDGLLPEIASPLREATAKLASLRRGLDAASDAAEVAPGMLGKDGPRNYLLMVQNNAEARSSGGIPGALAELVLDDGRLSLGEQSSAADVGIMSPPLALDPEQLQLYSARAGKFMQDVNLTPDFPTAASTAQLMWERKTGKRVDGVVSVDPVALQYILDATGPVQLTEPALVDLAANGMPTQLRGDNVVKTLLSDVYAKVPEPAIQDAYFAGVAKEVFSALSKGQGDPKKLIEGITRGTEERRVLVWSASGGEQEVLARYPLSGSISGPSVSPAQFGVYFNDGTGAKMDYYVHRTVQLIKECPKDGYEQASVRITSTNVAPRDAADVLPPYVTGAGNFGVPAGSVQTNIVAYGPIQADVEMAKLDGQKTNFAPYLHSNRPVGVLAVRLAPGESRTVEFTFGRIVQHTEPYMAVTPTVQPVNDVMLPTAKASCS